MDAIVISLPQFVHKWTASTRTERAASQEHFIDLCRLLEQPTPNEADPTGEFYAFEKGTTKVAGGEGFADVWMQGHFAWEYKGKRKNLDAAYQQLLQYREDLENPPLLVVCDLVRFEIHTNFTGTAKRVYAFSLTELDTPGPTKGSLLAPLEVLRALFTTPARLRPDVTAAQVTERAAAEFAALAASLRQRGIDPERAAHFLMRLLFCLFAEDIGLLPQRLFSRLVEGARTRSVVFEERLRALFEAMAHGGSFGVEDIAHFDGGLFADAETLPLTTDDLAVLARTTMLDWSSIEPAIFGTLFERSLDPSKRSQLGAHYTSREDILLIVEPVLIEPLRRRWREVQMQAADIIAKRAATPIGATRTRQMQALARLLTGFAGEIAALRVLDPACGSGNFLYVALKRLLDLEKEVITFAATNGLSGFFPQVGPEQLHGIELNAYAHELAQVVVWIGYIQWLHDNGYGVPRDPILKPLHTIRRMDAILSHNVDGLPLEPEWANADVIIGNPPFLGGNRIRHVLGDTYIDELFGLYESRVPALSDLVCYWFEKARALVAEHRANRVGLLATQAIRGGANRTVLERIKANGDIFWAWADRNWVLNGAVVHVSMVAFDDGREGTRTLNGLLVTAINADLTSAADLSTARPLPENKDICMYGSQQKGSFDIPDSLAAKFLAMPSMFGRHNVDVVKRTVNGLQLLTRIENAWVIDFGVDMPMTEAALYEGPFDYVKATVLPERAERREKRQRDYWWLHARPSPRFREILKRQRRYCATSQVSKHRIFVWLDAGILADHTCLVFGREDDYFFGMLQSRIHELWARRTGTQLREAESGSRYTPSTSFETFPFPWPPGDELSDDPRVEAIAQAARELVTKRNGWLNPLDASEAELKTRTLTNLYNERPSWLDLAHQALDRTVLDAYGWPHTLTDEDILERLLALNLSRIAT